MSSRAVNLAQKLDSFSDQWAPKVVASYNGNDVCVVRVEGEFVWHRHADTDEVFIVLDGRMRIELRDGAVELGPGEMFVVPRDVEHKPSAASECHVLLVEPGGVVNTGDAGGALTAPNDVWI